MRRFYWGSFFIACGLFFLASNLGWLNWDFAVLRKFWPLLLILWGTSMFFTNQKVRIGIKMVCAVLIAGVIFAFFDGGYSRLHSTNSWSSNCDTTKVTNLKEDYDSAIQEAELNFSGGAGEFSISDSTSLLLAGTHSGDNSRAELNCRNSGTKAVLNLEVDTDDHIIRNRVLTQRTAIKLNTQPVWDIDFSVGAADCNLDLTAFKIRSVNIDAGAASLDLKLGSRLAKTNVEISAGASSVSIKVPQGAYCVIKSESALSSIDAGEGFKETSENNYQTDNQTTATSQIEISVDAGVSSVEIERY